MTTGILLTSALWLLFQPAQSDSPMHSGPMRNTFAVATETVIDTANAVDLKADDPHFDSQMQQLKLSKDNLASMAADDREKEVVTSANNLIFLISACHIQAKSVANTDRCESQFANARNRIMETINKHKSGAAWVDGPPS